MKNNLIVNMQREVLYLSETYCGAVHDKRICAAENWRFGKSFTLLTDTGFQGLKLDNVRVIMPTKKPRAKELSEDQVRENRWIGHVRVRIEHVIGSIKRFRIVSDVFRHRLLDREDSVMLIACALNNWQQALKNGTAYENYSA